MASKSVIILANAVTAKLHEPDQDVRLLVSEMLSYKVPGAEHMRMRNWDGYSSLYVMRSNTFPAGFVRLVTKKLKLAGYTVRAKIKEAPDATGPLNPKVDNFPADPRYDYQEQTMERLVQLKRMIAQVATGGGKSRIFKLCEQRLGLPTLFITTRKSLMYQMAENYRDTLFQEPGLIGDGHWSPKKDGCTFAIVDTLVSRLEKPSLEKEVEKEVEKWMKKIDALVKKVCKQNKLPTTKAALRKAPPEIRAKIELVRKKVEAANPIDRGDLEDMLRARVERKERDRNEALELLENVGFLCLEEAHEVSSSSFYEVANSCKNAQYRLALTATPFMKDDEGANMKLMAVTGGIGIKITEKMLIERGILAKPYFKYIKTPRPKDLGRSTQWQKAYEIGVVENQSRHLAIITECNRAKQYGLTMMILVNHVKHGEHLERLLRQNRIKTKFIKGADSQAERKEALDKLGSGQIECLIGTTILDVGIDVPSVGMIILAGAGKAEVNLRQRIGRGLRSKKSGPNIAFVIDFEDRYNNHLVKHYRERRRIVEETEGFAENIVNEFDYKGLGLVRSSA